MGENASATKVTRITIRVSLDGRLSCNDSSLLMLKEMFVISWKNHSQGRNIDLQGQRMKYMGWLEAEEEEVVKLN